ncbi:MAG: peptide chain release factor N(5)-glutamine methyltransferase [Eubacteriales bacterium]|nr:peptide chain release factor N(5)-glutamine methyltransferase [Eubacteriales bacterium]
MNFRALSKLGAQEIQGIENAQYDAQKLLAHVIGSDMLLAKAADTPIAEEQEALYLKILLRRKNGEPLQYIIGETAFMGLMFCVDSRVLIPRFDTETVVSACLEIVKPSTTLLDMCTGSGAIAISIKHLRSDLKVTAADISTGALSVARYNAERHNANIAFLKSDMFENINGSFDTIICNPPYIKEADMQLLSKEVKQEPVSALVAGEDGLIFYRRLFNEGKNHLKQNGYIVCELGFDQDKDVAKIAYNNGFSVLDIKKDLNNIPRALIAQLKEKTLA